MQQDRARDRRIRTLKRLEVAVVTVSVVLSLFAGGFFGYVAARLIVYLAMHGHIGQAVLGSMIFGSLLSGVLMLGAMGSDHLRHRQHPAK